MIVNTNGAAIHITEGGVAGPALVFLPIGPQVTKRPSGTHETVPNMGAIMLPSEMSGDAGSCCRDPLQTSR
jgi:hypothetical protein